MARKIITAMALALGYVFAFFWSFTIILSYPQFEISVLFNEFGEGMTELIVFPLITAFIAYAFFCYLKN